MYREVIEDPSAIPDDVLEYIDCYSGQNLGRIYRITPEEFQRRDPPRLADADVDELIGALEHSDGWRRETSQRLLFERQDQRTGQQLRKLVRESDSLLGRLHALWLLDSLGSLDETTLLTALNDSHSALRESGVRLAERHLPRFQTIQTEILSMASDADPRVRFRTALLLSKIEGDVATRALANILRRDPKDEWIRAAVFSTSRSDSDALFKLLVTDTSFVANQESLLPFKELAALVGARNKPDSILSILRESGQTAGPRRSETRMAVLAGIAGGLLRSDSSLSVLRESRHSPELRTLIREALQEAQDIAASPHEESEEHRLEAIRVLGWAPYATAVGTLAKVLSPGEARAIQLAAVRSLSMHPNSEVGTLLVHRWRSYSPPVRREVVEALLGRADRLAPLLDALEEGLVPISHLDPSRRQTLLDHHQRNVRLRARKVFEDSETLPRAQVFEGYRSDLVLAGDTAEGSEVFARECATCHQLADVGHNVGPNLREAASQSSRRATVPYCRPERYCAV